MDSIKAENQMHSGVQQRTDIAESRDRALSTVIPEQSDEEISSWVLLFGSFLLIFNTWCVKHFLYPITAKITVKADMRMNTIGAC